jgi:predicted nuclease of predicted toxin-antitoxin system
MRILIDMNLAPAWAEVLNEAGHDAIHWSTVGDPRAPDRELMAWANRERRVVFTHDLDFGALLAVTGAEGPSVLQVRAQDTLPNHLGSLVLAALGQYREFLEAGALVALDEHSVRARILPLRHR